MAGIDPKRPLRSSTERVMTQSSQEQYLKIALRISGTLFLLVYPLCLVWPSGWVWHDGAGSYYLQMLAGVYAVLGIFLILAARNPREHRSLISFTIWSSLVHGLIMGSQAVLDKNEHGHLIGDVPAILLIAAVLAYLAKRPVSRN